MTEEEIDKVYETFTAYYKVHCMDKTRPYEGIYSLIHQLRDSECMVAVLSNKKMIMQFKCCVTNILRICLIL